MKKRHHHYVWRNYLRAWAPDDAIWCCREGKVFKTNLMGVGQKRDFYKLKELTALDILFIRKVAIEPSKSKLEELNEGWIETFRAVELFRDFFDKNGYSHPEIDKLIDEAEHNFEEEFHTLIEGESIKYIDSILKQDVSFYSSDRDCMNFAFFLCTQYMRTNKIQQNMLNNFQDVKGINIENCWSIMRHVFATNMAWVLFANRDRFKLVLIINETDTPFITGDQPVVNTYAAGKLGNEAVDDVEFYYPVSPKLAILISERDEYESTEKLSVTKEKALEYNLLIIESSHEQIYASSDQELKRYSQ